MSLFRALLIAPYHSLALISDRIKADYPDLDLTIHEGDLHRGLEAALGSFETDYDVVISRGGTAQMLEDEISIPVIEIAVSGSDLLRGLAAHNPLGKRCAVIGFSNTLESVAEVADFSDFDLDVFEVAFEDELPLVLQEIFEEKYEVVLCDNFAVQKCRELGINAHLLESGEQSVRAAFKRAAFLCQQTSEIQKKSHLLWDLLKSLPSAFALFSASGKLVYTNLPEARNDLLPFMREHLDDPAPAKLTLQRAGKVHRISLSHIGAEGEEIIAFNVSSSPAPAGERLVGLRRQNRDEVEQRYRESVFKATGGGEAAAPLVARLAKTNKPIMLEGEIGVGKAQIVYLIYLSGTRSNHPLVIIDCSLLVDKSWDYLMNSTGSPLYGSGQTIYFKAAHALEGDRLRYLLDVLVRSGTAQRSQLIFSANDDSQGTERGADRRNDELPRLSRSPAAKERRPSIRNLTFLDLGDGEDRRSNANGHR